VIYDVTVYISDADDFDPEAAASAQATDKWDGEDEDDLIKVRKPIVDTQSGNCAIIIAYIF
jgi:hypothetical protein